MSQPKLFRNNVKQVSILATIAILGMMTILSAFFLVSDSASNSYAASVNSEITAEVDGTHYVTLSAPDVTFSINPTDSAQLSKQSINVSVETNAPGGADLYLSMANSTNALHLNGDTTSAAPAIEATASSVAANSLAANTWGYSTDDQTYSAVPTNDSDPALLAAVDGSSVGSNAGGIITASIPVYYAANVDTSIPAGSYSNRLAYSAVVDGGIITSATLTKIEIDGSTVENMQPEVENTLEVTTNLMTNTYGTPRVYLETTDPAGYQECGDVVVSRNESGYMTITCKVTPTQAATGVTLHIVPKGSSDDRFCTDNTYQPDTSDCEAGDWKWGSFVIEVGDIKQNVSYMQNFNASTCNDMNQGNQIQLVDSRDDKTYWIGKLTDNNCWMTQNLDLDLSTSKTLTSADTNLPDGASWTPSANTSILENGSYNSSDTNHSYASGSASTGARAPEIGGGSDTGRSYDPGDVYYGDASSKHYHAGNYYQWSAATAGHTDTSQSAQSICPKGWILPSQSQFQTLIDSDSSVYSLIKSPYYFLQGGTIFSDSLTEAGADGTGFYWSSTPFDTYSAEFLTIGSNGANMDEFFRNYGMNIRCVAAG